MEDKMVTGVFGRARNYELDDPFNFWEKKKACVLFFI